MLVLSVTTWPKTTLRICRQNRPDTFDLNFKVKVQDMATALSSPMDGEHCDASDAACMLA